MDLLTQAILFLIALVANIFSAFAGGAAVLMSALGLSATPALSADTNNRIDPAYEACLQDLPVCLAQNGDH